MGESTRQKWEHLQREYRNAVQASYPNPERRGCAGVEVLQDLAARSVRFEEIEEDPRWKHVIHCGPCYSEYLDLRESCRAACQAKAHRETR